MTLEGQGRVGCGGRIRTYDLQLMRLAGTTRLPYPAIINLELYVVCTALLLDRHTVVQKVS